MRSWRAVLAAVLGVLTVAAAIGLALRSGRDTGPSPGPAAAASGTPGSTAAGPTGGGSTGAPAGSRPAGGAGTSAGASAGTPAGAADDPLCQARAGYDRIYLDAFRRYGARDYRSVLRVSLPAKVAYYRQAVPLVTGAEQEAYRRLVTYQVSENFAYQRYGWDPRAPFKDPVSWPQSPIEAYRVVNALMRTRCGLAPPREPGSPGG